MSGGECNECRDRANGSLPRGFPGAATVEAIPARVRGHPPAARPRPPRHGDSLRDSLRHSRAIFFFGYNFISGLFTRGEKAPPAAEPQPAAPVDEAPQGPVSAPGGTARAIELALAKTRQLEFLGLGHDLKKTIDDWAEHTAAYERLTTTLAEGEDGRAVARDEGLLSGYRVILAQERPSPEKAATVRSAVETLVGPIERAHRDPGMSSSQARTSSSNSAGSSRKPGRGGTPTGRLGARSSRSSTGRKPRALPALQVSPTPLRPEPGPSISPRSPPSTQCGRRPRPRRHASWPRRRPNSARLEGEKERELELARRLALITTLERERMKTLASSKSIQADFQCFLAKGKWTFPDIG